MRNLEYKTRVDDLQAVMRRVREIGADLWGDLRQTDTYFAVADGRLKLRETAGYQAQLIFYRRDEDAPVRFSDYELAPVGDGVMLKSMLSRALGVLAEVRKRRTLLSLDSTRVHLDNVDKLGFFLEIEVPVHEGEDAARERLQALIGGLGLRLKDGIRASYLDLVLQAGV